MTCQRIVIVGGGFAGVTLAQELKSLCDTSTEVVVVSRDNHLVFTPMLPEVAGRSISPFHVAVPGRVATKRPLSIRPTPTS
jgi:NADH:ubiquinone reductase (H+-translocating)